MRSYQRPGRGPSVPPPQAIDAALNEHQGLARLGVLLRESKRRMDLIAPCLPGALTRFVKPGPIDEEGWSLLASNAAVAAKLRQLHPRLEEILREHGLTPSVVRIKILQK